MSAGGGGGTGGGISTTMHDPLDPETQRRIEFILTIGCGEVIPKRNNLVVHCNRMQRCSKCQARFDNLSKLTLIELIEMLFESNVELERLRLLSRTYTKTDPTP